MDSVLIGIAGGTGSGKSTFTNRLKEEFSDRITVIYYDNYYRLHDNIPVEQRAEINYDRPDAFETDLLIKHLEELKKAIRLNVQFTITQYIIGQQMSFQYHLQRSLLSKILWYYKMKI